MGHARRESGGGGGWGGGGGESSGQRSGFPSLPAAQGSRSSRVIQSRPPNVFEDIHLPDLLGIWVWVGVVMEGCCTTLPNKTHGASLDLFLGRAGGWLQNRLTEPTHPASPPEALHGPTLLPEGLPGVRRPSARGAGERGYCPTF